MTEMDVAPETRRRRVSPALLLWLVGVVSIVFLEIVEHSLARVGQSFAIIGVIEFFAWLLVIGLTLYGLAVFARWVLRNLFWTVGRRLFLSYLLIGMLPFFLMTILMITVAYMFAAVMTQAAVRAERQATLGQMESWTREYTVTGRKPAGSLPATTGGSSHALGGR